MTGGATPAIQVSEQTAGQLTINLGTGSTFDSSSSSTATGLVYQNAGSPSTSQYATVDISQANNVTLLQSALAFDTLNLGPNYDASGGLGGVTASAAVINVTGLNTAEANGNEDLLASGPLNVAPNALLNTGLGTSSLAADMNADGAGDSGTTDPLANQSGPYVLSSNSSTIAITLRGAAINIDTSSNPAHVGGGSLLKTTPTATLNGVNSPTPWRSTARATSLWPTNSVTR